MADLNFIRPMRNKVLALFANAPLSVREMLNRTLQAKSSLSSQAHDKADA